MLTAEREQQIRDAWAASVPRSECEEAGTSLGSIRLPLHRAFELLFTAEERAELDMDDFFEDIAAHLASTSTTAAGITLNQALAYIKEQQ